MRSALGLALAVSMAGPAFADEACKQAVSAAFSKQREARPFVMATELKSPAGPVEIKFEFQPPDRMRQVVTAPNQAPVQTILFGKRAYTRQGEGKWEELMPAIAHTIIAQVRAAAIDPPQNIGDFSCLGTATFDGKSYLAYRSVEKQQDTGTAPNAALLHRTIYVDPDAGLPAANIVAGEAPDSEVVFKATYTYPGKIEIEDHPDAPLVKMR